MTELNTRVGEVTARIAEQKPCLAARLSRPDRGRRRQGADAQETRLRQSGPRLRSLRPERQGSAAERRRSEPRDRHRLQRHALGSPALRPLSRPHQAGGARGRGLSPGRGWRPGDVRRRHPGRSGHGAVAVLARRDRALDRGRAVARHVRRRRLSRGLRQDRAGPPDRRPVVRTFAGGVPPGWADAVRPAERRQVEDPPALRRRQGDARRFAGGRGRRPITRRGPAPSTAPRTPIRC